MYSKPPAKIPTNLFAQKLQFIGHFLSPTVTLTFIQSHIVSSESHNIRTSSVRSAKRTLRWIRRSRSFKVMLNGVSRNPEWAVVVMYHYVETISETFQDIASGKLQVRRFQPHHMHRFDDSSSQECFRISRNIQESLAIAKMTARCALYRLSYSA